MIKLSYSFHMSQGSSAIRTSQNLMRACKHNLREKEKDQNRDGIVVLEGPSDHNELMKKIKDTIRERCEPSRQKYNRRQKRQDRQIKDVFNHLCNLKNRDITAEFIIQVGDRDFWADNNNWKELIPFFQKQLDKLKELAPDFEIMSAVVHLEEQSPHMHIIGLPFVRGKDRKLELSIEKSAMFPDDVLEMLQDRMRETVIEDLRDINPERYQNIELKEKEEGRNHDIFKHDLAKFYGKRDELQETLDDMREQAAKDEQDYELERQYQAHELDEIEEKLHLKRQEIKAIEEQKKSLIENMKIEAENKMQLIRNLFEQMQQLIRNQIKRYKGRHYMELMDAIKELELTTSQAKELEEKTGLKCIGEKTFGGLMDRAERHDVRAALLEAGVARDDFDDREVKRILKNIHKGVDPEEAILKEVCELLDDRDMIRVLGDDN